MVADTRCGSRRCTRHIVTSGRGMDGWGVGVWVRIGGLLSGEARRAALNEVGLYGCMVVWL